MTQKTIDLNREVSELLDALREALPPGVRLEPRLTAHLLPLWGDPEPLRALILRLAAQACAALPRGGVVLLRTANAPWSAERFGPLDGAPQRPCVEVALEADAGGEAFAAPGVAEGEDAGRTLAVEKALAQSLGGFIEYRRAGEGVSLHALFPAADLKQRKAALEGGHAELPGGSETLLLVDDEEIILEATGDLLARFGYTVLTAASGEEALELFSRRCGEIGAVLLDLGLPGMDGRTCLERMRDIDPGARVIISSGFDAEDEILGDEGARPSGFLPKPFRLSGLLLTVRGVLDA